MQTKAKLIIVGGGIAGLMAAMDLADSYEVTILEAAGRMGGRIESLQLQGFSKIIEAGPEFIHGRLKNTLQLLKEADIPYVKVEGTMLRNKDGQWKEQDEMIPGWDELLKRMKRLDDDMTLAAFLQQFYGGPENAALRNQVATYAEGFDLADIERASVFSLYKEWSNEEEINYRIPGGYGRLVRFLEKKCVDKGCILRTGQVVKRIDWKKDDVSVHTSAETYAAGKVVVTVPIGILQQAGSGASIHFTPSLEDYMEAAAEIGMGSVIKIAIQFNEALWPEGTGFILSEEKFPTWWTQWPDPVPILTGWMGGTRVAHLSGKGREAQYEAAVQSLGNIFRMNAPDIRARIKSYHLFDWKQNEFSKGAYTYATPGSHAARKVLNTPVEDTIFFCGEGLYEGNSPGTVEAAIIQAKETARKLLRE